jgi:hypothetical protein
MKKTTIFRLFGFKPLFLLVFLITTLTLTAQTYLPMAVDSSYWVLSDNDNCSNISFQTDENITQYYLYGDTVISSVAYKKVYRRTGSEALSHPVEVVYTVDYHYPEIPWEGLKAIKKKLTFKSKNRFSLFD